jgi:hypothetical protein
MNIYPLDVFPRWGVCMKHSGVPILGKISSNGYFDCYACKKENKSKHRITGIRFVTACNRGHLDDMDWPNLVHMNTENQCNNTVFTWIGEGQSATAIKIQCHRCKQQISLSQIYKRARKASLNVREFI